jgi:ABC-type antimicrobial peptide transport system permease subunit
VPGLALGLVGVLLSGRVLRSFLYEVEPGDPLTLELVSAAVALLVTAAALVPARRAARTDPMAVLRGE